MSNAFTADRERNYAEARAGIWCAQGEGRRFVGSLQACVAWINKNRRKGERITMKSGQGLYPRTSSTESRRQ